MELAAGAAVIQEAHVHGRGAGSVATAGGAALTPLAVEAGAADAVTPCEPARPRPRALLPGPQTALQPWAALRELPPPGRPPAS